MADATLDTTLQQLDIVAFLDPAGGKRPQSAKTSTARSAIVVVGQDFYFRVYVLYAWADRVPTPQLVNKLFEVNRNFHPRIFGGEADALQSLFQDAIKMIAHDRNEKLPLSPVQHSTRLDKDFRIRTTLQPLFAEGRLILQENQHDLLAELEGFPSYSTKDLVDALASACNLLPQKPLQRQKDEQAEALAEYLRQTGAPAWYIEQKMQAQNRLRMNPVEAMMRANAAKLRRPLPRHLQNGGTSS